MICPLCASRVGIDLTACPSCGVGLKEYATIAYLPDWFYNQALAASRRQDWPEAITRFAQAATLAGKDRDILRGWARALVESGQIAAGLDKITDALELGDDQAVREDFDAIYPLTIAPAPPSRRPAYLASRSRPV